MLQQSGLSSKEQQALHIASRRNTILATLKAEGGPFTTSLEVEEYKNAEKNQKKHKIDYVMKSHIFEILAHRYQETVVCLKL